jgi:uncharacterized membrane protein (GlpM family)
MPAKSEPLVGIRFPSWRHLPLTDLLIRFGFGAAISAVAGIVALLAGNRAGGILLAFPAILPATLTLVEKEESERRAEDLDVGSALGAAALGVFAVVVWQYMGDESGPLVLLTATVAWFLTAVVLYLGLRLVMVRRRPLRKGTAGGHSRNQ